MSLTDEKKKAWLENGFWILIFGISFGVMWVVMHPA